MKPLQDLLLKFEGALDEVFGNQPVAQRKAAMVKLESQLMAAAAAEENRILQAAASPVTETYVGTGVSIITTDIYDLFATSSFGAQLTAGGRQFNNPGSELVFLRQPSHPGAVLNVDFGGGSTYAMRPGTRLKQPFSSFRVFQHPNGVVTGPIAFAVIQEGSSYQEYETSAQRRAIQLVPVPGSGTSRDTTATFGTASILNDSWNISGFSMYRVYVRKMSTDAALNTMNLRLGVNSLYYNSGTSEQYTAWLNTVAITFANGSTDEFFMVDYTLPNLSMLAPRSLIQSSYDSNTVRFAVLGASPSPVVTQFRYRIEGIA